jgi:hypothetical protein
MLEPCSNLVGVALIDTEKRRALKQMSMRLFAGILGLFLLSLTGCFGVNVPSNYIREMSWNNLNNSLLFTYEYDLGSLDAHTRIQEIYKVSRFETPIPKIEKIESTTQIKLETTFSSLDYIRNNIQSFAYSDEKQTKIKDFYIRGTSYLNPQKYLLVGHFPERPYLKTWAYSLIDLNQKIIRDIVFKVDLQLDDIPLIRWTGNDNDVLVEYKKEDQIFHTIAHLDDKSYKINNLKIFKQYQSNISHSESGDFLISRKDDATDVMVLGFENADTVYYLEKPPKSKTILIYKKNLLTDTEMQIGQMDKDSSYYDSLYSASQVSIPLKKVAYSIRGEIWNDENLMISDFDGSNQKILLKKNSTLPKGDLIRGPQ